MARKDFTREEWELYAILKNLKPYNNFNKKLTSNLGSYISSLLFYNEEIIIELINCDISEKAFNTFLKLADKNTFNKNHYQNKINYHDIKNKLLLKDVIL